MRLDERITSTLPKEPETIGQLQDHMIGTYHHLRVVMIFFAVLLPVLLLARGIMEGSFEASMSAYYYSASGDWFVGSLWAIGAALIAYKGFSTWEDWFLNVAGVCAIGVAMFPVQTGKGVTLHALCAWGLFLPCAWVCWRHGQDTLDPVINPRLKDQTILRYRRLYKALGGAMVILPILVGGGVWSRPQVNGIGGLFAAEMTAFFVFAVYWFVKTLELRGVDQAVSEKDRDQPLPTANQRTSPVAERLNTHRGMIQQQIEKRQTDMALLERLAVGDALTGDEKGRLGALGYKDAI